MLPYCLFLLPAAPVSAGPIGAVGDLYLSTGNQNSVRQYDGQDGAYVTDFVSPGSGGLVYANGLAFGPNGNLFVCSNSGDEVIEYNGTTGQALSVFAGGGGVDGWSNLAFGPNGNLYVSGFVTATQTHAVLEYDGTSGAFIGVFAQGGGLTSPFGLAFGPNGDLFVASIGTDSILEYDGTTGAFVREFASGGGLDNPLAVIFGPGSTGNLFVSSSRTNSVLEYDGITGAFVRVFASGPELAFPWGRAFRPNGNLLVVSLENGTVIEYDGGTGALVGTFIDLPSGYSPTHVTIKPFVGPYPAPALTGLSPATADNCGVLYGATVTGTGLSEGAQLKLARAGEADIFAYVTAVTGDTSITVNFNLQGAALGLWDLVLTYPDGQSATLADALDVDTPCPPPQVTGVTPDQAGDCTDLSGVTITGTNILFGASVKLTKTGEADIVGTVTGTTPPTAMTADFPITEAALGFWDVVVTNPGGSGSDTLADGLEITPCPPPEVTGVSPDQASDCSTRPDVQVDGTGFLATATVKLTKAGELDLDGVIGSVSPTSITADFPLTGAALGVWDVVVTNPGVGGVGTLASGLEVTPCPPLSETRFRSLGFLAGHAASAARAVSADGSVVVGTASGPGDGQAFRWTEAEGMVGLGFFPDESVSLGAAVSADGTVVVGCGAFGPGQQAFRWTQAGGMVGIGDLPGGLVASCATGISADGDVIAGSGSNLDNHAEAFRWTQLGMVGLGDLPGGGFASRASAVSADGSVVVGETDSFLATGGEAFRWTAADGMVGLGVLVPGQPRSQAQAVSANGSVVVGWSTSDEFRPGGSDQAFRWTAAGSMVGLGILDPATPGGNRDSRAWAVSADGSVVVGESRDDPFIWDAVNGMRNLEEILVNDLGVDLTGWDLRRAEGVSADGLTVVGGGYGPSGYEAWIARLAEAALVGDLDDDGDVDLDDHALLVVCMAGPDVPATCPPGVDGDLDDDGDADLDDFGLFQLAFLP